jgi:hypothetical protein
MAAATSVTWDWSTSTTSTRPASSARTVHNPNDGNQGHDSHDDYKFSHNYDYPVQHLSLRPAAEYGDKNTKT